MRRTTVILMVALVLAFGASAGELSIRRYPLPGHGDLLLPVPDAWQEQPPFGDSQPPTLTFVPKSGPAFVILITPLWPNGGNAGEPDSVGLRANVERMARAAKKQAIEKTIPLQSLKGAAGVGYYFSATDRQPKPGEFRHLTQGALPLGDGVITFTVLTNDGMDATVDAALHLLEDCSLEKTSGT